MDNSQFLKKDQTFAVAQLTLLNYFSINYELAVTDFDDKESFLIEDKC